MFGFSMDVEMDRQLRANLDSFTVLDDVEVIVGTDLTDPPYPVFLEYGTSRMGARPSARPAFEQTKTTAIATMAAVARENFRRGDFSTEGMVAAGIAGGQLVRNRWAELAPVRTGTYRRSIQVEAEALR